SLPASREGSMMVVQLAEPLGHLGIAVPSGARNLETGEATEETVDEAAGGDGAATGEESLRGGWIDSSAPEDSDDHGSERIGSRGRLSVDNPPGDEEAGHGSQPGHGEPFRAR